MFKKRIDEKYSFNVLLTDIVNFARTIMPILGESRFYIRVTAPRGGVLELFFDGVCGSR